MAKLKYSFKSFFDDINNTRVRVYHNDDWVSNGHFAVKKDILTKTHLRIVNKHPQQIEPMTTVVQAIEGTKKLFEDKGEDKKIQFKPDLIVLNYNNNRNIVYDKELDVALAEEYYNFITDRKCKIYMGAGRLNPLVVLDKANSFMGIVLPFRIIRDEVLDKGTSYSEYVKQLEAEKRAKDELKKLNKKCLYISNNKAVIRNKPLKSVAKLTGIDKYKNLYIDAVPDKYNDVELFIDLGIIHISTNRMIDYSKLFDDTEHYFDGYDHITLEFFKNHIDDRLNSDEWITVSEIKLMELAGKSGEYIDKLWQHRDYVRGLREKERLVEEKRQREKDNEFLKQKQAEVNNRVLEAEKSILNKEKVTNVDITIYKDKYDSNTTSLILHLFKLHGIKVPLRTQGWINSALADIIYDEQLQQYRYRYYSSSSDSTVFGDYLDELIAAIENKYSITA